MPSTDRIRLHALDTLRGACLISMMAYHGLWNLAYLFGIDLPWYRGLPGYVWQQSICWTFLILSGFCWRLGRHHLKRGLMIFGGGIVVSLVTHLMMPADAISFGILTCTGSCVLLMIPLDKPFRKVPAGLGMAVSIALFVLLRNCNGHELGFENFVIARLPDWLYRNWLTTYLGFPMPGFRSADYFPILPWSLLFIFGYFLHGFLHSRKLDEKLFAKGRVPVLNLLGRHSLLVYLLHQPVLYGITELLSRLGLI